MYRSKRFKLVIGCLTMFMAGTAEYAAAVEVVVRKQADQANPTLAIRTFNGDSEMRQKLIRVLTFADWFDVKDSLSQADYLLDAAGSRTAAGAVLSLALYDGARKLLEVSARHPAASAELVVYDAVDRLIEAAFNNPGPCRSQIAFVSAVDGHKEILTCRLDGASVRSVTRNGSISTEPAWGGSHSLVYTLYRQMQTEIVLVNFATGKQRRLASYPGMNVGASLSPDGKRAAVCLSRGDVVDLYVKQLDTGELLRVTKDAAVEASPCWSPDGTRLCYVSDRAGRPQLYIADLRAGRISRLLNESVEMVSPSWSAVSNRITFAAREGGQYVLCYVDLNEPVLKRTVYSRGAGDWESPSWAPDGRHVVCTRARGRQREICIVDSWHGRVLPITRPGDYSLPDWSAGAAAR